MTKEEFKKRYYALNKMRERGREAKDATENRQVLNSYLEQIDELVAEYRQCYPYFKEAVFIRAQFQALLDSPDYLDYLHDNSELFTGLLEYAQQINAEELPRPSYKQRANLVAAAIGELWKKETEDGNRLFRCNYQWQAIYQVITEHKVLPIKNAAHFRDMCLDPTHWLYFLPAEHSSFEEYDPRKFTYYDYKNNSNKRKVGGTYCELSENRRDNSDAGKLIKKTKEIFITLLKEQGVITD